MSPQKIKTTIEMFPCHLKISCDLGWALYTGGKWGMVFFLSKIVNHITRPKRIQKRKYTEEENQSWFGEVAVANKQYFTPGLCKLFPSSFAFIFLSQNNISK